MKKTYRRSLDTLMEYFDLGPLVALTILVVASTIVLTAIVFFIRSAPPTELTITSGPEGSIFYNTAQKYASALKKNGIKVHVLSSMGSVENLKRMTNPKHKVDLALVQSGGEDEHDDLKNIVSLGGISYQPIFFFYRGPPIQRLAQMKDKIMAIGPEGSGARRISLKLLKLNDIEESPKLLAIEGEAASQALKTKKIDAAFMMSEDASVKVLRDLMHEKDIHLLSFKNAHAYARKLDVLHILDLPEGVIDFANNIPHEDITLLAPMVELIATKDLHPALSDMILDAATKIHGSAGVFKKRGEFPISMENKIKLSSDASRFYQSGKSFLYRYLPFWLASLLNRILVAFLPMLIILIPAVRSVPALFRWAGQMRIRRRYRALLRLEGRFKYEKDPQVIKELKEEFESIERDVQAMKVRAVFADQFYALRVHIDYVRKAILAK